MPNLNSLQKAELRLLHQFVEICDKHHFRYIMLGGTMLGAVRHGGFIPWDDDIDMGMPRQDYECFIKWMREQEDKKEFHLNYYKDQNGYIAYPAKLENLNYNVLNKSGMNARQMGAWIDIFPLDGMPGGGLQLHLKKLRLLTLRACMQLAQFNYVAVKYTQRPWYEKAIIQIAHYFNPLEGASAGHYADKIDKLLKQQDYNSSPKIVNFMGAYKFKEMFEAQMYKETDMYRFEDLMLPGVKNSDLYLTQLYGKEYMAPPNEAIKNKHMTKQI